jgi:hypothetical protein
MPLLLLTAWIGGGCSLFLPARGSSPDEGEGEDGDTAKGEGEGEGEDEDEFAIVAIDGDGSLRPVAGALPADVEGIAAEHRVARRLRVSFDGTRPPDAARYVVDAEQFPAEVEQAEDGVAYVTVPTTVPLGRVVLLTLLAGAASAEAQVFFLQGEPGPPGPAGPPGPRLLVARGEECPFGGDRTRFGIDEDGDGVLAADEVDVEHNDCNSIVTGEHVLSIPDEEALRFALERIASLRIAPSGRITLQLPAGEVTMTAPLPVDHVDGERLRLIGQDPAQGQATTMVFPDDGDGIVVRGGLRLDHLNVTSPSTAATSVLAGTGIDVQDGGFVVVEGAGTVVISGFDVGVRADSGGIVAVDRKQDEAGGTVRVLQAVGNNIGFAAGAGGVLEIPGALSRDSENVGFIASGGSVSAADSASENAARTGYLAQFSGFINATRSRSTVRGSGLAAYLSSNSASLLCGRGQASILADGGVNARALFVAHGASANCSNATLDGVIFVSGGSTAIVNNVAGTGTSMSVENNATLVRTCDDATIATACRAVVCTGVNGGRCIGP